MGESEKRVLFTDNSARFASTPVSAWHPQRASLHPGPRSGQELRPLPGPGPESVAGWHGFPGSPGLAEQKLGSQRR